ncbi:MAG: RNA methyltransferase [Bacteroidales bacterium]|nr:RNA methyltransferase [Bacteroidales bacterium]MCF8328305.1 RNA methyltransferase [Bacteroidales bacterium]
MNIEQTKKLREYLHSFITSQRAERIRTVLQHRTRHITFALENIYQGHNASAVLRSCEINGIQDVHIIENSNTFKPTNDIALGSSKWLTLHRHSKEKENTLSCINHLKSRGYTIVSTTPHKNEVTLEQLPLEKPVALLFGTELSGLSDTAIQHSDQYVQIPMYGFTESYNISVSAAICAYSLMQRLRKSDIPWTLSENEIIELETEWYRRSIKSSKLLEEKFWKEEAREK